MNQHTMQIELEGLISLLAQNLYADPDVFLREMIQNAHDSIVKRAELARERGEAAPPPGAIRIVPDPAGSTLAISDNGSGLTEKEIHEFLSTIGRSGTRELKERLLLRDRQRAVALIGQFGIGLLSAFIVAHEVEVITRPAQGPALRWRSTGDRFYTVTEADRDDTGSTVILHLNPEHARYLQRARLQEIVRTYADFIGLQIFLGDETEPANAVHAPWHRAYPTPKAQREAYYAYWESRFASETSLDVLPVDLAFRYADPAHPAAPREGRVRGVLGITDRHTPDVNTRGTVDLYIARMFIASGSRDLLPPWARFIQGIIESDALTPNAARDNVVRNEALAAAQEALGKLIVEHLVNLSRTDRARFVDIMRWHSYHVLAMCVQDEHEAFFRAVADIVPLVTNTGPMAVQEYLRASPRLPDGKQVVYYITEHGSENQFYLLCSARSLLVFNASEQFAERFLERYARTWPERIHLSRLDVAGSDTIFEPLQDGERERFRELESAYLSIFPDLRCVARVCRFLPDEVPAVLTETKDARSRREMDDLAKNLAVPGFIRQIVGSFLQEKRDPLTLHLNANSPLVQRLAARPGLRDATSTHALVALYNNAFMLLARAIVPEDVRRMFGQYNQVIALMLEGSDVREKLERERQALATRLRDVEAQQAGRVGLSRCVTCFVAMPFRGAAEEVYRALEQVLEDAPFLWNVVRADEEVQDARGWKNVEKKMTQAHCFVAEVSDHNPDVMIAVGRMEALGRPVLLLRRKETKELPVDLRDRSSVEYEGAGEALVAHFREAIHKNEWFCRQQGEKYLSEVLLLGIEGLGAGLCKRLAVEFESCEDLLKADPGKTAQRLVTKPKLIEVAQEGVRERLAELG